MESTVRMLAARVANTSVSRTLERALRVVGGPARLAEHLGVGEAQLMEWLAGRGKPPNAVYLRALDLVASGPFAPSRRK
jgi:hypothetical protein